MDGHNGSENIHVHIIINSLRKLDVERQTFMERPCDSRVGYKHHLTNDYLKHLQQSVMDMCHRENLQMTFNDISEKCKESRKAVKSTEASLKNINQQIYYTGQYLSNKPFFAQMLKFRNKKKFRQEHQVEITLYESAVKLL